MKVTIGEHNGKAVKLDIDQLLRTRALIQANSGGGKSYVLRKLLEETHGKVQHLVIDPEGEFSTLREKFDYVLVGKGGDIHADVRTAPLLAERLLELNASAIIDLYELKQHHRIQFVKLFLDALVNVDKRLWHPALVVIDEAHIFCPEKGESEAMGSVIDICTRGRKRSFCAVLATQRLSKLHKDAAAECNNKPIGRTGLDIDLKRAAEELGITSKEDARKLRQLEPGNFFAFGPAISLEVIPVKIGSVVTSHPDIGSKQAQVVPAPQEKVRKVLEKLGDLPRAAEEKQKTMESLQTENRELKRRLREKPAVEEVDTAAIDKAIARGKREMEQQLARYVSDVSRTVNRLHHAIEVTGGQIKALADLKFPIPPKLEITTSAKLTEKLTQKLPSATPQRERFQGGYQPDGHNKLGLPPGVKLGACERSVAGFLAGNPERAWSIEQVGIMTGYSPKSGGFNNALSKLNTTGLIVRDRGSVQWSGAAVPAGVDTEQKFSIDNIKAKLGKCEKEIFEAMLAGPDEVWDPAEIAAKTPTNYSPGSGGFNNSLSRLSSLGVLLRDRGKVRLTDDVKELL